MRVRLPAVARLDPPFPRASAYVNIDIKKARNRCMHVLRPLSCAEPSGAVHLRRGQ